MSEWDWLLNVTCNDISVLYVTSHRYAGGLKKKLDLRLESQRHRHSIGFFNVPVQASTLGQLFKRFFWETALFQPLFTTRMWIRRAYSHLKRPGSPRGRTNSQPKRRGHKIITQTCKVIKIVHVYQNIYKDIRQSRLCSARLEASTGQRT